MKNEQPKNAGQPKTVSVAAGNYTSTDNGMPSSEEMEQAVVLAILTQSTAICEVGNRLRPEMLYQSCLLPGLPGDAGALPA